LAPLQRMMPFVRPGSLRASSPGIRLYRLSTDPAGRPLPHASPHASVAKLPLRNPVPSSWFLTTAMVSSARRSRACCIPLPIVRFAAFPDSEIPLPGVRGISRDVFHTPRRIPPYRSRSTSLWPLPPCRCLPAASAAPPGSVAGSGFRCFAVGTLDFEAFLRCRVRSARATVASRETPYPSWALFPFEVLLRTVGSLARDPCVGSRPTSSAPSPAHARAQRRPDALSLRRGCRG